MDTLDSSTPITTATTALPSAGVCSARICELLQSKKKPTTLVICHDEAALTRRLATALADETVVVLKLNQSDWNLADDDLQSGIITAIETAGVNRLIFVGHSEGSPFRIAPEAVAEIKATDSLPLKARKWLEGAKQVQSHTQQSRNHFASEMGCLLEIAEVQTACKLGKLQLEAFFYIAHSGSFLRFETEPRTFREIGSW